MGRAQAAAVGLKQIPSVGVPSLYACRRIAACANFVQNKRIICLLDGEAVNAMRFQPDTRRGRSWGAIPPLRPILTVLPRLCVGLEGSTIGRGLRHEFWGPDIWAAGAVVRRGRSTGHSAPRPMAQLERTH